MARRGPAPSLPLRREILERMNIGERYWGAKLSDFSLDALAPRTVAKYVGEHDTHVRGGWGLFIYGPNGTGKTYLACATLRALAELGYTTYCVLSSTLKVAFIDGQRFDPKQTVVQRVNDVDVLLVEDLGAEYSGKGNDWAELCFENTLRLRTRNLLPTIVTTNLDRKAFAERYKTAAASLAMESMIAVSLTGDDFRRLIAQQKAAEFA